jgi:hypothetical protein
MQVTWQIFTGRKYWHVIYKLEALRKVSRYYEQAEVRNSYLGELVVSNSTGDPEYIGYGRLYSDALVLCKALVAALPLPLVCNNPGCETLGGVSEVASARKVCAGCRCRYCSAACQAADWKRHKKACRRMAAAGQACR